MAALEECIFTRLDLDRTATESRVRGYFSCGMRVSISPDPQRPDDKGGERSL